MAKINFDHLKNRQKIFYNIVNFHRIWTKIGTNSPQTTLSNIAVRSRGATGSWEEDISSQSWKIKKIDIFWTVFFKYLVSQWNLGKMTFYTFSLLANSGPHANFQENHRYRFRDLAKFSAFLYTSPTSQAVAGPYPLLNAKASQKDTAT